MSRTAAQEYWGDTIAEDGLGDDYYLRLPYGQGGCRFYLLGYSTSIFSVYMPDARLLQVGGEPQFVVACTDKDFELYDATGVTLLATLTLGDCVMVRLISNSTEAGTWAADFSGGYEAGTDIPSGRVFYDVRVDVNTLDFILLDRLTAMGYDGVTPAVVRCTIAANKTLGASSTTSRGFDTGGFPTGTIVLLTIEAGAVITGIGGIGGRGGDVLPGLLSQVGQQGGHGMRIQDNTVLVNYGTIQGGGGGGGGGAALSSPVGSQQSGGGGGAGAGYQNGGLQSGDPGDPARATGYGGRGGRDEGGLGGTGYVNGGDGGDPGQSGSAGTAAGGAAGDAIQRNSGRTLTKLVAGTITGAETTY